MTWKLVDDGSPREIYAAKIYINIIFASMGGGLFGYDNAFLGAVLALPSFKRRFGLEGVATSVLNNLSSNIVITFQAGCFVACFLCYPLTETIGRRNTLTVASVIFSVGAAIMLVGTLDTLYAGRFLTGLGVGPMTVVVPMYLSETAPPAIRGRCMGCFEVAYQIFALLGFWASYATVLRISGTNEAQWRVPVALQLPLVGILLIGCLFFLPETPRFLLKKGRNEQALKVLANLRNLPADHTYVLNELSSIRSEIEEERLLMGIDESTTVWQTIKKQCREALQPGIRYRISIGMVTQLIGQMSGINGINYYAPRLVRTLGITGTSTGLFATGIYGVVKTVTAVVTLGLLVDRMGRRALLLWGCGIMTIGLFFVGGYLRATNPAAANLVNTSGTAPPGAIAALAFVYVYVIGFVGSFAGIPWILSSEAVPLNVRAISATLGGATQWIGNLAIAKATPYMITSIGYGTFFFFGCSVIVGTVYVWFFVPETRGVPLEDMAVVFGGVKRSAGQAEEKHSETFKEDASA